MCVFALQTLTGSKVLDHSKWRVERAVSKESVKLANWAQFAELPDFLRMCLFTYKVKETDFESKSVWLARLDFK